jgi:hypothetical protein
MADVGNRHPPDHLEYLVARQGFPGIQNPLHHHDYRDPAGVFAQLSHRAVRKTGMSRGVSIALILLGVLATAGSLSIMMSPILVQQLGDLTNRLPQWLDSGSQQFHAVDGWLAVQNIPLASPL